MLKYYRDKKDDTYTVYSLFIRHTFLCSLFGGWIAIFNLNKNSFLMNKNSI